LETGQEAGRISMSYYKKKKKKFTNKKFIVNTALKISPCFYSAAMNWIVDLILLRCGPTEEGQVPKSCSWQVPYFWALSQACDLLVSQ
jgi:hypothetical protein